MIPGGTGTMETYQPVAAQLADRYTVITYTRRGFGGSPADSVPADRLAADTAHASALLQHLTEAPAQVFGSSSGAIVALRLLAEHPDQIRTLVAREPPLLRALPDGAKHLAFLDDVHATRRRAGIPAAMAEFAAGVGMAGPPAGQASRPTPEQAEATARRTVDLEFWMEHEMRQYPRAEVDLAILPVDKLILANSAESANALPALPNHHFAQRLGIAVRELPGGHIGYRSHPIEFADALAQLLAR
jgi:pimeloyl-ACP methyl ester carboxylesterase